MTLSRDKLYHFIAGSLITLLASFVMPLAGAFILACLAGVLKEAYDSMHPDKHTCDTYDFIATALGGLATCLILIGVTKWPN